MVVTQVSAIAEHLPQLHVIYGLLHKKGLNCNNLMGLRGCYIDDDEGDHPGVPPPLEEGNYTQTTGITL